MAADDGEGEGSAASAVLTTNGCCDVVVVVVDVSSCKQQPLKPQVRQVLLSNLALAVCLFHNPASLTLVPSFSLYSLPQQLPLCEMDLIAVVQNGQVGRYGNVQSPQPISDPDGVAIGAGCRLHTLSIYVVLVIGSVVEVLCSYLIAPMPTPTPFARICPDKEPGWPVAVDSGLRWWSQQSGDSSDRLIAVMLHLAGLLAHAHHHVLLGRPLPVNQVRKLSRRMHGWRHVPPPWSP